MSVGSARQAGAPGAHGGRLLLEWLQLAVGDMAWVEMLMGDNPNNTLYAALASLPTCEDEPAQARCSAAGSAAAAEEAAAQVGLAAVLGAAARAGAGAFPSTVAEDEALLEKLLQEEATAGAGDQERARGGGGGMAAERARAAARLTAVRYRLQRKRVWGAAEVALRQYEAFAAAALQQQQQQPPEQPPLAAGGQ